MTPPEGPTVAIDDAATGPSRAWYWVGGALIPVAIAGAILWFALTLASIDDEVDGFDRVPIPGSADVELDEGRYTLYYERPSGAVDDRPGVDELGEGLPSDGGGGEVDAPDLDITLTGPGGEVEIEGLGGNVDYDFSGRDGTGVAGVGISEPGTYTLNVASAGAAPDSRLVVGRGIGGKILLGILIPFVIGGAGFLAGIVIIVITAVRRQKASRARGDGARAADIPQGPPPSVAAPSAPPAAPPAPPPPPPPPPPDR